MEYKGKRGNTLVWLMVLKCELTVDGWQWNKFDDTIDPALEEKKPQLAVSQPY